MLQHGLVLSGRSSIDTLLCRVLLAMWGIWQWGEGRMIPGTCMPREGNPKPGENKNTIIFCRVSQQPAVWLLCNHQTTVNNLPLLRQILGSLVIFQFCLVFLLFWMCPTILLNYKLKVTWVGGTCICFSSSYLSISEKFMDNYNTSLSFKSKG